mmetsp:Transcript_60384/g.107570  ORF Transcript_60384/g.107570 Transcript_60384/m.107570 type:complete len:109 (+) Transcript_60384:110-436(+)
MRVATLVLCMLLCFSAGSSVKPAPKEKSKNKNHVGLGSLLSSKRPCKEDCAEENKAKWQIHCMDLQQRIQTADTHDKNISLKLALRNCNQGKRNHLEACHWRCGHQEL